MGSSDEEFEEPRPKKRRRKSKFDKREPDQSSMTQFERGEIPRPAKTAGISELDEDGFQIWDDYDPERFNEEISEKQKERRRILALLRTDAKVVEHEPLPEIPETSRVEADVPPDVEDGVGTDIAAKTARFQTPRKVRSKTEVPSSQTPPSTKSSMQSATRIRDARRSPLKERSSNVQSSQQSPESQNISVKMLERVRFATRQVPLKTPTDQVTISRSMMSSGPLENEGTEPVASPPTLQRMTTIQDSQAGDASAPGAKVTESLVKLERSLKRVTTVQDSQYEELDLDQHNETNVYDASDDSDGQHGSESFDDDTEQATFDPANSALDRDAARFAWTQTQRLLSDIHEDTVNSETDEDDLDHGCATPTQGRGVQLSDVVSYDLVEPIEVPPPHKKGQLQRPTMQPLATLELSKELLQDDSAYESGVPVQQTEAEVPSSPPPLHTSQTLHPSQISTVVPTQASQRPPSRQPTIMGSQQKSTIHQSITILSSPERSAPVWPETMSSSPLALPPWNSLGKAHFADAAQAEELPKSEAALESLVDFSLPPPPPLSSSRRQTPASSSL